MTDNEVFLAYRGPKEPLRFYQADSKSPKRFHFVDFNSQQKIELGMRELEKTPELPIYCKGTQAEIGKAQQIELLNKCIADLKKGAGNKVVLSRFQLSPSFKKPLELVQALDRQYPDATVYCFAHPETGTWLGASPENLLSLKDGRIEIDSLAGTRKWEERHTFKDKERREQEIVSTEIVNILEQQSGLSAVKREASGIKRAGNLAHIHTLISAQLDKWENLESLLGQLHPTPAVGGQPKAWALKWLQEHEKYQRRFYCGYFGWSEADSNFAQFWVNLRCAEFVKANTLALYLGGGITAESNAQDEWEETLAKAQTILKVLD